MKTFVATCCLFPVLLCCQSLEDGKVELQKGHAARAKEIFEKVLAQDGNNAEANYRLGSLELRRDFRDEDGAVDHMEKAAELDPQNAEYQYGLGVALGMKAQSASVFKQAFLAPKVKKAFQHAVELNPKLVEARIGLAQYYVKAPSIMGGDEERGWKELDTAVTLDEFKGRSAKAGLLLSEKKADEAEAELKLLSSKMPGDWRVWNSLTNFYLRQKRNSDAVVAAQKCVTLKPDSAESYKNLGQAELQDQKLDSALENLKKALRLDNDHIMANFFLAKTYAAKGLKQEAKETFEHVLQLDPPQRLREEVEKNLKELSS